MAKVTFRFEHQGFHFRRTSSSKTYTHAVLTRESRAADRAEWARNARLDWARNLDWNTALAERRNPLAAQYPDQYPQVRIDAEAAAAKATLEAGVEHMVRTQLMRFDELRALQQVAADGDTYFACQGWCSRLDLAEKLAARFDRPTVIVEVEVAA